MIIPVLSLAVSAFTSLFFPGVPAQYHDTPWPLEFARPAAKAVTVAVVSDSTSRMDTVRTAAGSSFIVEHVAGIDPRFEPVIQKLIQDGWPEDEVRAKFADPRTAYIPRLVRVTIRKPSTGSSSSSSAYAWVNTTASADACRAFLDRYAPIFEEAKAKYGVDPELIAALLRCETQLGRVTGDYHVFSVYATMALMDQPGVLGDNITQAEQALQAEPADSDRTHSELDRIRTRSASKANWAYKELIALMQMDCGKQVDAMDLRGSWAGAFGWSQFLPSSFLRNAVDGDGDNRIDLFSPADAIFSVANYLSNAGYRSSDRTRVSKALWSYNNSSAYVESIMGLADRLRAQ
jgi:membrane-bound lytic murein transglycosylase B